ncbi:helix-turn-helix transcriptional regulator [Streptomyces avicenniae]|uniref:helix-turn-helix transcriptional regulator n=1 Tax=Streptomyces avicenniae TaxID=500153 RepID=UPI00069A29DE|nr:helix-turn-helix transcriptional regulator [Streptomyces avicenniae]
MTTTRRRPELGAFLRSRRGRIRPEDVGMPPGFRRRTPGLRREEVAQLAGVGVTWYTWLEQGRPINVSAQVLDAVARTLRLDQAERQHLYHLAEVPHDGGSGAEATAGAELPRDVQGILDALHPLPAVVLSARFDALGLNRAYAALSSARPGRNVLRTVFCGEGGGDCPIVLTEPERRRLVATLRWSYGNHAGEPVWEAFIAELTRGSAEFAQMWANGDVVPPGPRPKIFRHAMLGEIRTRLQSLSVDGMPEARMDVFFTEDATQQRRLDLLLERTGAV